MRTTTAPHGMHNHAAVQVVRLTVEIKLIADRVRRMLADAHQTRQRYGQALTFLNRVFLFAQSGSHYCQSHGEEEEEEEGAKDLKRGV